MRIPKKETKVSKEESKVVDPKEHHNTLIHSWLDPISRTLCWWKGELFTEEGVMSPGEKNVMARYICPISSKGTQCLENGNTQTFLRLLTLVPEFTFTPRDPNCHYGTFVKLETCEVQGIINRVLSRIYFLVDPLGM